MPRSLNHGPTPRRARPRSTSPSIPAGTNLYDEKHPPRKLYLIESGLVELSSEREAILGQLTPGCFFGENSFLAPAPAKQAARTLLPTKLAVFRKSELLDCLQRDRRFAARFLRSMALRMYRYEETIRDFITERTERRLARLLCRLSPPRPVSGWVRLPIDLTNPELAKMAGTTRWQVSHYLNRFYHLGWLRRQKGLWIHREGLHEFLERDGQQPREAGNVTLIRSEEADQAIMREIR